MAWKSGELVAISSWNLQEFGDGIQGESETIQAQDTQAPSARTIVVPGIATSLMLLMLSFLRQEG